MINTIKSDAYNSYELGDKLEGDTIPISSVTTRDDSENDDEDDTGSVLSVELGKNLSPRVAVGIDFDCVLTKFHYFHTYNWGTGNSKTDPAVMNRFLVANPGLQEKITVEGMDIIKRGGHKDLHSLMTTGSKHDRGLFIRFLLGEGFDQIIETLKQIIDDNSEYMDIDLYLLSNGRIDAMEPLFLTMLEMGGEYEEFLSLLSGIYLANTLMKDQPTMSSPKRQGFYAVDYDSDPPKITEFPIQVSDTKSKVIDDLIKMDGYKLFYMIDDTSVELDRNEFVYIQPGEDKVNRYSKQFLNFGRHYLLKTLRGLLVNDISKHRHDLEADINNKLEELRDSPAKKPIESMVPEPKMPLPAQLPPPIPVNNPSSAPVGTREPMEGGGYCDRNYMYMYNYAKTYYYRLCGRL